MNRFATNQIILRFIALLLNVFSPRAFFIHAFAAGKKFLAEIARAGEAPHGPEGPTYPGICRALSADERKRRIDAGEAHAIRLDMESARLKVGELAWDDREKGRQTAEPEMFGDVVLARRDTPASYHLAATLDDDLQGVNLVVRGMDLFTSTHVHRLLQALFGLTTPVYHHHDLLTDAAGRRYAKRDRALTIRELRQAGKSPADVRALAGLPAEVTV